MAEIIEMPKLSDTMTTGTLVKWLKNEGDEIATGDMIAEVETDKATMEVECFEDGVMLKRYVAEGDSVSIGSPICAVGEEGEDAPEPETSSADEAAEGEEDEQSEDSGKPDKAPAGKKDKSEAAEEKVSSEEPTAPSKPAKKPAPSGDPPAPPAPEGTEGQRVKSSPLARKIAVELGVDLTKVKGSGPGGRIVRADVEAATETTETAATEARAPAPAAAPPSGPAFAFAAIEEKTTKVSNMRASIARALVKSKQEAPHFYLQSEVDAGPLARIRKDLNGFLAERDPQAGGVKYTVNDLILRAAVLAAQQVPGINRSWQGEKILQSESIHLAFGVAIDEGLVTPVIRDAQDKPLRSVAAEARELIGKARNRKLKPEEMSGSTLTVTNLGMFGITDFYGIINPGNAAILSVGATRKEPVVDEEDRISVGYRMKVGLSGDHRVIDGAVGAQYLDALGTLLEKPSILLV